MTDVLAYVAANRSVLSPGVTARFGSINDFVDATHAQNTRWPTQGTRDFHPYRWWVGGVRCVWAGEHGVGW